MSVAPLSASAVGQRASETNVTTTMFFNMAHHSRPALRKHSLATRGLPRVLGRPAPRFEARDPAPHVSTEIQVLRAELGTQPGLLEGQDPEVEKGPHAEPVLQEPHVPEEQRLADNQRRHRHIYRVANVAVQTRDHESLWWGDGRRGAKALEGEACEGVEQDREPGRHQQSPEHAKPDETDQRWGHAPA